MLLAEFVKDFGIKKYFRTTNNIKYSLLSNYIQLVLEGDWIGNIEIPKDFSQVYDINKYFTQLDTESDLLRFGDVYIVLSASRYRYGVYLDENTVIEQTNHLDPQHVIMKYNVAENTQALENRGYVVIWLRPLNEKNIFPPYMLGANSYKIPTIAAMKAIDLPAGMIVETNGYHESNDGAGFKYEIITGDYTDDGGLYHLLDNGNFAHLIFDDTISPKAFGAKGDGINDDTQAIQKSFDYLRKNPRTSPEIMMLHFPDGTYLVTDTLKILNTHRSRIYGSGVIVANMPKPILSIKSSLWFYMDGVSMIQSSFETGSGCIILEDSYIITFNRMTIDGGDKNFNVVYGNNVVINQCSIRYGNINFYTTSRGNNTANIIRDSTIEKAVQTNMYFGFTSSGSAYGTYLVQGCYIEGNNTGGQIYIKNGIRPYFEDCYIHNLSDNGYAVLLDGTLPIMNTRFSRCYFENNTTNGGYAFRQLSGDIVRGAILDNSNFITSKVKAYNVNDTYIPKLVADRGRELEVFNLEGLVSIGGSLLDWSNSSTPPSYTFSAPMGERGSKTIDITAQYVYKTIYLKKDVVYTFNVMAKNNGAGTATMQLYQELEFKKAEVTTTNTTPTNITFTYAPPASGSFELLLRNSGTTTASFSGCYITSYETNIHINQ